MLARRKSIALFFSLGLVSGIVSARASNLTCPLLEVSSIESSAESEEEALRAAGPDHEAAPSLTFLAERSDGARAEKRTLIALGPILDSLDSQAIKMDLACTANGAMLVVAITRYSGGVKKNVFWRPRIKIVLTLRQPEARFEAAWKMRRTDGTELDHVGLHQKYPVTVKTTIRSADATTPVGGGANPPR